MRRFYIPKESIKGKSITIRGGEAHHILDVMRFKKLDKLVAFDGTGSEYVGFIKEIKGESLEVELVETRTPSGKEPPKITLIQAIPKKDKTDYIIEKATELGVQSIIPVITDRTVVRWSEEKKASRVERWRRIAKETSKQCMGSYIPRIEEIMDFEDTLDTASDNELNLIAALNGSRVSLRGAIKDFKGGSIALAIGPEGDFTPEEIKKAASYRFRLVSLGNRILKSETAGMAALAILNYEFGN